MATIDVGKGRKGSKWECGGEWVGWMCMMYICVHLCGWVGECEIRLHGRGG